MISKQIFRRIIYFTAISILIDVAYAADGIPGIKHNPFKAPNLLDGSINTGAAVLSEPTGKDLDLRAILLDGKESMAQVGGELLRIGDVAQGYKLVSVRKDSAIFIKQGKQIQISVYKDDNGQGYE